MYDHLLKENSSSMEHFKQVQDDLNEKLTIYISKCTELEIENNALKIDVRELTLRNTEEMERLRDEYERMIDSNRKLYDDELEMLRAQREEEAAQFDAIKGEYEHEIQTMMEHQKAELEDLDHVFRDEMEAKAKECLELMQRNNRLAEELEELKIQAELRAKELPREEKKKGRMPKRWNADLIEEQEEEDEPIETV